MSVAGERNEEDMYDVMQQHHTIGWGHLFKDRFAKKWSSIQQKHYDSERSKGTTQGTHLVGRLELRR